jgi:hypothetical protein
MVPRIFRDTVTLRSLILTFSPFMFSRVADMCQTTSLIPCRWHSFLILSHTKLLCPRALSWTFLTPPKRGLYVCFLTSCTAFLVPPVKSFREKTVASFSTTKKSNLSFNIPNVRGGLTFYTTKERDDFFQYFRHEIYC